MKLLYEGSVIGNVLTNRSMTLEEAILTIGYDVRDEADCQKAYEDGFLAAYIDDMGLYQIDTENIEMEY